MQRRLTAALAAAAALLACEVPAFADTPAVANGTGAIFMYHHVSPSVLPGPYARALTLRPDEFRGQLSWLQTHGCKVVSVDELRRDAKRRRLARCEAALTFDDGYDDVAIFALPLLRAFHDTATFYIATGYVGTPGHLTVSQLRALQATGMEIGAHTVHHVDLTALSAPQAAREVDASAASLRRWLNAPVTSFAYPAGQFNRSVAASVRAALFDNAVTTEPGHMMAETKPYELPRYRITRGQGESLLQAVFGQRDTVAAGPGIALRHIARERIAGNDPAVAEDVAVALLARSFPEQILKVHVLALPPASVAGIVLSGVKFHRAVNRRQFEADAARMVELAFEAAPGLAEVDVWATAPVAVSRGASVSGDYAVPASKTVFSAAVTRAQVDADGKVDMGRVYWDPQFLR